MAGDRGNAVEVLVTTWWGMSRGVVWGAVTGGTYVVVWFADLEGFLAGAVVGAVSGLVLGAVAGLVIGMALWLGRMPPRAIPLAAAALTAVLAPMWFLLAWGDPDYDEYDDLGGAEHALLVVGPAVVALVAALVLGRRLERRTLLRRAAATTDPVS